VLDGEVVVLRDGRPDFDAISGRLTSRRLADWAACSSPATFVAFDLLELDGRVLADEPYAARTEALAGLGLDGPRWALTPSDGDGEAVWAATRDFGLEVAREVDEDGNRVHPIAQLALDLKVSGSCCGTGWRPRRSRPANAGLDSPTRLLTRKHPRFILTLGG
jgi:bifunctional non-homologous end joining protein LigD